MDINKIFQSKWFGGTIIGITILIAVLLIFKAGMIVGAKKADFSCRWSDNYHQNFGGPQKGFLQGFGDRDFMDSHGVSGQILKIDSPSIIIKGIDNVEKIITTNEGTIINRLKDVIKISDLKIDDNVVVIGSPNQTGQIEAKLIRVIPAGLPIIPQEPQQNDNQNINNQIVPAPVINVQ